MSSIRDLQVSEALKTLYDEEVLMLIRITYLNNCQGSLQEPVVANLSRHSIQYLVAYYTAGIRLLASYADQSNY